MRDAHGDIIAFLSLVGGRGFLVEVFSDVAGDVLDFRLLAQLSGLGIGDVFFDTQMFAHGVHQSE